MVRPVFQLAATVIPRRVTSFTKYKIGGLLLSFFLGAVSAFGQTSPTIATLSANQTVAEGASVALSVSAGGSGPLSYQWRKDGADIPNAMGSAFVINAVHVANVGVYTVVVSNSVGSVTSNSVFVSMTTIPPPYIASHPPSRTLYAGDPLTLFVGAGGGGPLSYQWRKDGVAIGGATVANYTVSQSAVASDAGVYTAVVTGANGSVTSEPCNVAVIAGRPPVAGISVTQIIGYAGFPFSADSYVTLGTPPFVYQWKKDGAPIPGATTATYQKASATPADSGFYSLTVSNAYGSFSTQPTLAVIIKPAAAPQITGHPTGQAVLAGQSTGFMVLVRDDSPIGPYPGMTYQWKKNGTAIPGATGRYHYIPNAQSMDAGTYTVTVTNASGSVTSQDAPLAVETATARSLITMVFTGVSTSLGTPSAGFSGFTGSALYYEGPPTISVFTSNPTASNTYQWKKSGVAIAGATSSFFTPTGALDGAGSYTVDVSGPAGNATSRAITLDLLDRGVAPQMVLHPASTTLRVGQFASLSVEASGELPISFQWKKDGVAIPGATINGYSVAFTGPASAGAYSVTATNRVGSVTSAAANITEQPPPTKPPVIATHPESVTVLEDNLEPFVLRVIVFDTFVSDPNGVTYQWRRNGAAITGATNYAYQILRFGSRIEAVGRYSVVVTNAAGTVTSYDANFATVRAKAPERDPYASISPPTFSAMGDTVTLRTDVVGADTFQWRKNGVDIAGATRDTLTLSNLQGTDAATYTMVGTNIRGSTSSSPLPLAFVVPASSPVFTLQPVSRAANVGDTVSFTVTTTGADSYRWKKNGGVISATGTTLTLTNIQTSDAGTYSCLAFSSSGATESAGAVLTVLSSAPLSAPTFTVQPANQTVAAGQNVTFSATATGNPTPTYQWKKDGTPISNAINPTFTIAIAQPADAGAYTLVATNSSGSVTSNAATLVVNNPAGGAPAITLQPVGRSITVGQSVTFTVVASGTAPLSYAWVKNGQNITGATSASLTLTNAQKADAGSYFCLVTNTAGTQSSAVATLVVIAPIAITTQPAPQTVVAGGSVTFTAAAQSALPLSYQWKKNGAPLAGATSTTLTLPKVQLADVGSYAIVFTNSDGSMESAAAALTVTAVSGAGIYYGTIGASDPWAMKVATDGSAVFVALLSARARAVVARDFRVAADGSFTFGRPANVAALVNDAIGTYYYDGVVTGVISGGRVTGTVPGLGMAIGGTLSVSGTTTAVAGYYQAVPLGTSVGVIDAVVAPDGAAVLVSVDAEGVHGGRGSVTPDGRISVQDGPVSYTGTIGAGDGVLVGSSRSGSGASVSFATPATAGSAERMINVSTRGLAGAGTQTLIAGFAIAGTAPKDVLIRAAGPALASFGVTGTLANPRVRLFKDATLVLENDDWSVGGAGQQISSAASRVGAFSFAPGSADAALLVRLEPGAYSAQVTADSNATGVSLVEVYDASVGGAGLPRLINLSTRGNVGSGDDVLIVGLVVSGTAPKRFLIRGIGPALTAFGVTGALGLPRLQLYRGNQLVRENVGWSSGADGTLISAAAVQVGAFALAEGSHDCALLLYLEPGTYTAQISGINGATGVALVEAYEVP